MLITSSVHVFVFQPGQHERELNPFWKAGGSGMPEEKSRSTVEGNTALAGDGGVGWLRKALRRCQEQAEEEGKSVEEVAAERYGVGDSFLYYY